MNFKKLTFATLVTATIGMTGCPSDDTTGAETDTDPNTTMTGNTMTGATMTSTGPTTGMTMSGTDPDTTETDPTNPTETDSETDTDTTGPGPDVFEFREDPPDAYAQVDRKGFPAVNTALIASKDEYNAGSPEDDAMGTFANEIVATLDFLHIGGDMVGNGLDDDLEPLLPLLGDGGIDVCIPPGAPSDNCFAQAAPFAVPDVVLINTTVDAGFPNGRQLEAPVIDLILAVVMLDLSNATALGAFVDLDAMTEGNQGLSQSGNDVEYSADFPYLGAAHE